MTHADVDNIDLQEALKKLLSDRFSGVTILGVNIDDASFCEDGVIEITVHFEGTADELVSGQPSGLFGLVRDRVADFCQSGVPMPVFNFISSDAHA